MKKILMFGLAVVLIIIALASLGNIIGLVISVAIIYYSLRRFLKSDSFWGKVFWVIIGLIGLSFTFSNLPALAGIIAIYLLYVGYKNWKSDEVVTKKKTNHNPFDQFEQQWNEIKK